MQIVVVVRARVLMLKLTFLTLSVRVYLLRQWLIYCEESQQTISRADHRADYSQLIALMMMFELHPQPHMPPRSVLLHMSSMCSPPYTTTKTYFDRTDMSPRVETVCSR